MNEKGDTILPLKIEDPKSSEFIAVEQEPDVDLVELQRNIIYPQSCKKLGIEGKIVIMVLVDKLGNPTKFEVEEYNNRELALAAIAVLKKTKFKPATQNWKPVTCWVSIPINFKLR